MPNAENHRTTGRVLDILEAVCTQPQGFTLSALCKLLEMPKSSIFPLLHTLESRGFLRFDAPSMTYRIGAMAFRIGNCYLNDCNVMDEIEAIMQRVVAGCNETCHFGTLKNGDVLYLKKVDSPEAIRMMSTVGHTLPAYATGIGKALLADYTLPALKKLYYTGLVPMTENTITDFSRLAASVASVQETGFAFECEESNKHIRCVAVPIRKGGLVVAAYSIAVPVFRYTDELESAIKSVLLQAKKETEQLITNIEIQF